MQEHDKHKTSEIEVGEDYMNPDDTVDEDTDDKEDFATTDEDMDVDPVTNKTPKLRKGYWI